MSARGKGGHPWEGYGDTRHGQEVTYHHLNLPVACRAHAGCPPTGPSLMGPEVTQERCLTQHINLAGGSLQPSCKLTDSPFILETSLVKQATSIFW